MRPAPGVAAPRRAGERAARYNGVDQYGVAHWIASQVNPFAAGAAHTLLVRIKAAAPGGVVNLAGWVTANADYYPAARVYVDNTGAAHWFSRATHATVDDIAGPTVADGAKHALAMVDDDGAVSWYLDGTAGPTGSYTRPGVTYSADQWCLGATVGLAPIQYLPGDVAEVAVLDMALTAGEIARWSDGTLDLRAYGEHLVAWFWPGDPPATAEAAPNMAGQRDVLTELNAPSIVEAT